MASHQCSQGSIPGVTTWEGLQSPNWTEGFSPILRFLDLRHVLSFFLNFFKYDSILNDFSPYQTQFIIQNLKIHFHSIFAPLTAGLAVSKFQQFYGPPYTLFLLMKMKDSGKYVEKHPENIPVLDLCMKVSE